MEKRGVVSPDVTRDVEHQVPVDKTAEAACPTDRCKCGSKRQIQQLDNDLTKRAADKAEDRLSK